MKKLSLILVALTIVASSCKKDSDPLNIGTTPTTATASFTMTVDGITYDNADLNSLILSGGNLSAVNETEEFMMVVSGVGADGSTVNVCTDDEVCDPMCTIMVDFGPNGAFTFLGESGTVKRTGNKIEISAMGLHDPDEPARPLTATIVVGQAID